MLRFCAFPNHARFLCEVDRGDGVLFIPMLDVYQTAQYTDDHLAMPPVLRDQLVSSSTHRRLQHAIIVHIIVNSTPTTGSRIIRKLFRAASFALL